MKNNENPEKKILKSWRKGENSEKTENPVNSENHRKCENPEKTQQSWKNSKNPEKTENPEKNGSSWLACQISVH